MSMVDPSVLYKLNWSRVCKEEFGHVKDRYHFSWVEIEGVAQYNGALSVIQELTIWT